MPFRQDGSGIFDPDPPAVPAPVLLSQLDFLDRFPPGSDSVIHGLAWGDSALASSVRAVLFRFQVAQGINPKDPRTAIDAQAVAQLLAYAEHITPEQIAAVVEAATA